MDDKTLRIALRHLPRGYPHPVLQFDIEVWSYNVPIMLIRHSTTNIWRRKLKDVRLFNIMDFDIGGPKSYKDDFGKYDSQAGIITIYDNNPLYAAMTSRPSPDKWDIQPPAKIKLDDSRRDLKNTDSLGPKDVAAALQWNLGDLKHKETKTVEMVLAAATSEEEVIHLLKRGWELFDKKMQ